LPCRNLVPRSDLVESVGVLGDTQGSGRRGVHRPRVDLVRDEADRSIGHGEVGPARMVARRGADIGFGHGVPVHVRDLPLRVDRIERRENRVTVPAAGPDWSIDDPILILQQPDRMLAEGDRVAGAVGDRGECHGLPGRGSRVAGTRLSLVAEEQAIALVQDGLGAAVAEPGPGVAHVARVRLVERRVAEKIVTGGIVQARRETVDLGPHRVAGADIGRGPDRTGESRVGGGRRDDPGEVHGVEEGRLLQEGEDRDVLAGGAPGEGELDALREAVIGAVIAVRRQHDLLEVVGALHPAGGLPRRLDRGQQQGDQDREDCDHDQDFNQRKAPAYRARSSRKVHRGPP